MFIAAFIILNLFVAIIADNFEEQEQEEEDEEDQKEKEKELQKQDENSEEEQALLTRDFRNRFTTAWATIDPDALHFIPKEKLRDLLVLIGPPAGLRVNASNSEFERLVVRLQLKKFENHLNFTEVLVALHRLMYKHIADSIPGHVQSDLSLDKKNVHQKVIKETLKRSGQAIRRQNSKYQRRKKSDAKKFAILKQVSEVAEHQKQVEESRPQHWEHIESNLTFEIIVRRMQRRFRFKRAMKRVKSRRKTLSLSSVKNGTKDDGEIFSTGDSQSSDDDDNDKLDFTCNSAKLAMIELVGMKTEKEDSSNVKEEKDDSDDRKTPPRL